MPNLQNESRQGKTKKIVDAHIYAIETDVPQISATKIQILHEPINGTKDETANPEFRTTLFLGSPRSGDLPTRNLRTRLRQLRRSLLFGKFRLERKWHCLRTGHAIRFTL
ncbi:MAG: hypothetical protein EPO43_07430 [Rugosibacter sp.]|nr:MAG: hypothetical protein EPO43_07430 [Rugosibacter sp.]